MTVTAYSADAVHDGLHLQPDAALVVRDGRVADIAPVAGLPAETLHVRLGAGTICPAFVDLQANGGGGVMFNDETNIDGLRRIADAHAGTGTGWLLPTLITDTPERTGAAIDSVRRITDRGESCIAGLHLEGPHLSRARKGAHDAALIREMTGDDLTRLCDAARALPALMVTLAPESATPEQVAALTGAGAIVSLGHSDADYETCRAAFAAGARCVTHLFNAMSQMSARAPGLVGAALDTARVAMGVIADGIHVHPASLRVAHRSAPQGLFLVTDCMAVLGSDLEVFTLNGRRIRRAGGRLTLDDGTLAGADLTMARAIGQMTGPVGLPFETAIAMATGRPGALLPDAAAGRLLVGSPVRAVHLSPPDAGTVAATPLQS